MKLICEFVGGHYDRTPMTLEIAEMVTTRRSHDYSAARQRGALVPRAELDNKPVFDGYLGPMWDGIRYQINGKVYHGFEVERKPELRLQVEREGIKPVGVLRYETQEVYNALSR